MKKHRAKHTFMAEAHSELKVMENKLLGNLGDYLKVVKKLF